MERPYALRLNRRTANSPEYTVASLESFEDAFRSLSEGKHITILAEGVPLRQHLNDSDATELMQELVANPNASLDSIVSKIARAYDYDSEETSPSMFLLHKRYTDPSDLPCVTYAEIVHDLRVALETIDTYAPAPLVEGIDSSSFDFYNALPQDMQLRARDGLTLADLNAEQRTLALAAARQVVLDSKTKLIRSTLNCLLALKNKQSVVRWITYNNSSVFGLEGTFGYQKSISQFPFSARNAITFAFLDSFMS